MEAVAVKQAERLWIIGDGTRARWHVGSLRKSQHYGCDQYIAACTGRAIYGPYGIGKFEGERPSEVEWAVCKRCDAIIAKATA